MLKAHPENSDPLSVAIAQAINLRPEYFWTRWGAARARRFYYYSMPVLLLVVRDGESRDDLRRPPRAAGAPSEKPGGIR
jgi:hypothetical protein